MNFNNEGEPKMDDKTKMRILLLADKERKEGESILDAANRLMNWIGGGETRNAEQTALVVKQPKQRRKQKGRNRVAERGQEMAWKLLEGMKTLQDLGERVTLKAACELTGLNSAYIHSYGAVNLLKAGGFVSQKDKGPYCVWTVLKTREDTVTKCPTKEAHGYGGIKKSGFGMTNRINSVLSAMSR